MAIYHARVSSGSRLGGQSGAAKVAYVLRRGKYAKRCDLVVCDYGNLPAWAADDPCALFTAADLYERKNGRLFVEVEVALPNELSESQQKVLVRAIAMAVTAPGMPFTYAMHAGRPKSPDEPANPHAHILISERVNDGLPRSPALWFRRSNRKNPSAGGAAKDRGMKEVSWVDDTRKLIEGLINEHLERARVAERVTADSHATRIDKALAEGDIQTAEFLRQHPPGKHVGPTVAALERDRFRQRKGEEPTLSRAGEPTDRGERHRTIAAGAERLVAEMEATAEAVGQARGQLRQAEEAVDASRSAGLEDDEILRVYETSESAEAGAGWASVEAAAAAQVERKAAAALQEAAEAKREAEAKQRAEQERETRRWEEQRDAAVQALERLPGGVDLYHAHLADLDPKWDQKRNNNSSREHIDAALAASGSDAGRLEHLRDVLSNQVYASRYREELGKVAGQFKTSNLDNALTVADQEREKRETRRWEERRDAAVQALERLPGGVDLYHAHLADLDPKWDQKRNNNSSREHIDAALAASGSDAGRLEHLRDVLSNQVYASRYREELGKVAGQFKTSNLDSALAVADQEREKRETRRWEEQEAAVAKRCVARLEELFAGDGGDKALISVLDAHKPAWRATGTGPADIDIALDVAELRVDRTKPAPEEHAVVVDAEQTFTDTPSAALRQAGERFPESSTHARVSRRLADRTLVRALAAGREEPPVSPTLVQRLFTWLRTQIDKLLERLNRKEKYEEQVRSAAAVAKENLPPATSHLVDDLGFLVAGQMFGRLKERARDGYVRDTISEVERDQSSKDANHPVGAEFAADARDAAVRDHLMKIAEESHRSLIAEHKKASRGWSGRRQRSRLEIPTLDVLIQKETQRHESQLLKSFEAACDLVRPQQPGRSVPEVPELLTEVSVPDLPQQKDATTSVAFAEEEGLKQEYERPKKGRSDISFEDFKKSLETPLSGNAGAGVGANRPAPQTGETPTPASVDRSRHD